MIVENQYLEKLVDIFDNNHQNFLYDRFAHEKGWLNLIYVEEDSPVGYAVVYLKNDFCEQEDYPIRVDNIKDNAIYIWLMVTKKGFENKGIGTSLIKYIVDKFSDRDIYSVTDINNYASTKIHCKNDFIPIKYFEKVYDGKNESYLVLERKSG